MERKLFCELGPTAYKISVFKGIAVRNIKDFLSFQKFAKSKKTQPLENIVKSHTSLIVRKLHGVDLTLQKNKETNLRLAAEKINGIIIRPGETFSFWRLVGHPSAKRGYKDGLTISSKSGLGQGVGGGLCQMANMIHWLVLHSSLETTELHHHSDALFPDENRRVPFGTGTSVFYKTLDYRFKNTLDCDYQLLVWLEDGYLCGELRSEKPSEKRYKIYETDNHFRKEGDDYYRISKVYRTVTDIKTGEKREELLLDNHSKVMYEHELIPKEQIRDD